MPNYGLMRPKLTRDSCTNSLVKSTSITYSASTTIKLLYSRVGSHNCCNKDLKNAIAPELAYDNLGEVQEGGAAQAAFLEAIDDTTSSERRQELSGALHRYCGRDTLSMVKLVRHLHDS